MKNINAIELNENEMMNADGGICIGMLKKTFPYIDCVDINKERHTGSFVDVYKLSSGMNNSIIMH